MEYLDFDLEVTAADGGGYTVRVLRSPAGEATGTMRLPFDKLLLQNRLQALQIALLRSGSTRRRVQSPESHNVETFGQELWDALFTGDVRARFEASRSEARRLDAGMRIKLRFADPELAALPWEYLFDADRGDYVTLSASTPVVRYISLPQVMEPLLVGPPLRVLGMIASPSDLDELDIDRERQRLDTALSKLVSGGLVELVWMAGSTARDLQAILRRGPWHIFHFVGHGGFDANRGEGLIVLTTDEGTSRQVSATDLGRLLGDHDPLRLAVLNACESARGDAVDVFASTAATLVRRGTPAVVAMQYEITDDAAIEFSRSFYEAIADGVPVDAALAEGRKGVAMAIPGTLEWGTPVLYMRAPDGVLFKIPEEARAAAGSTTRAVDVPPVVTTPLVPAEPVEADIPPVAAAPAVAAAATVAAAPPVVVSPVHETPPRAAPVPPAADVPFNVASAPPPAARGPEVAAVAGASSSVGVPGGDTRPPAVASWTVPGATSGARPRTGGNSTRYLAIGGVVLLAVAAFVVSILGSSFGGLGTISTYDDPGGGVEGLATDGALFDDPDEFVEPHVSETGRIVFSNVTSGSDGDLFTVDPRGDVPVLLTADDADDRYPAWSRDREWIAFTRRVDGRGDIWMMRADGSDASQVTVGDDNDFAPAWTPDGSGLAFASNLDESDRASTDVWYVSLAGSQSEPLVGDFGRFDSAPTWSPDGGRIVYSSDRAGDGDAQSLFLFDTGSRSIEPLTTPASWLDSEPIWSPDGLQVVFRRASEPDGFGDIWTIRLDDRSERQLTTDAADESHPAISPDGTSYAFVRLVDGSYHVIVVDADSTERDLTANLGGNSYEPSWR